MTTSARLQGHANDEMSKQFQVSDDANDKIADTVSEWTS